MVTFHPAYVLRQTGGEIDAVKRLVWADLKADSRAAGRDAVAGAHPRPTRPSKPRSSRNSCYRWAS